MNAITEHDLILSLIKDDLINTKLVLGLNQIGFDATIYFLNLSNTVFKLMGFDDDENSNEIFELYMKMAQSSMDIDISHSNKPLEDLALLIYNELQARKTSL